MGMAGSVNSREIVGPKSERSRKRVNPSQKREGYREREGYEVRSFCSTANEEDDFRIRTRASSREWR